MVSNLVPNILKNEKFCHLDQSSSNFVECIIHMVILWDYFSMKSCCSVPCCYKFNRHFKFYNLGITNVSGLNLFSDKLICLCTSCCVLGASLCRSFWCWSTKENWSCHSPGQCYLCDMWRLWITKQQELWHAIFYISVMFSYAQAQLQNNL